jgi:hypothetical protein
MLRKDPSILILGTHNLATAHTQLVLIHLLSISSRISIDTQHPPPRTQKFYTPNTPHQAPRCCAFFLFLSASKP